MASVEIIVADGGSQDGTQQEAKLRGVQICESRQGRGPQMNAGARLAAGETLLFLHADSNLPQGWDRDIVQALQNENVVGGAFSLGIAGNGFFFRFTEWAANLRGRLFGLSYGDQGYFVKKDVFDDMKGYPEVPIMEDVIFWRRLRLRGRVILLESRIMTSPRRWMNDGRLKVTWIHAVILVGYLLGVPLERLSRLRSTKT